VKTTTKKWRRDWRLMMSRLTVGALKEILRNERTQRDMKTLAYGMLLERGRLR